jgi:hypothetical protein
VNGRRHAVVGRNLGRPHLFAQTGLVTVGSEGLCGNKETLFHSWVLSLIRFIAPICRVGYILHMRTNVTLDDDIYQLVDNYAKARDITLGSAIGELVRKANPTRTAPTKERLLVKDPSGILIVADGKQITSEMVKEALEDSDLHG